jgi:hypothetical protein
MTSKWIIKKHGFVSGYTMHGDNYEARKQLSWQGWRKQNLQKLGTINVNLLPWKQTQLLICLKQHFTLKKTLSVFVDVKQHCCDNQWHYH